jgi:tRNA pseudouridine38-40 synthase
MRLALGIEYDGTAFHGWQYQGDVRSVQELLQVALSRVANHDVTVQCAGRTDTGVHATGQVVHFETSAIRSERSWILGSNVNLPADISVCWAKLMPETFHARFSAIGRHY